MSRHRSTRPRPTWASPFRILTALALGLATIPFVAGSASAAAPSSISIDGNQAGLTDDWQGLSSQPYDEHFQIIHDPIGNADTTSFNNSESDYPNWQAGSPGTPSGKSDIGNVYIYDYRNPSDHLIVALAWDRAGYTGTGRYYVELNQKKDQGLVPDRLDGDRRITIGINGNGLLECKFIETWMSGAWDDQTTNGCSGVTVNAGAITDYFNSPNDSPAGTLGANKFLETTIDLTDAGATSCPVSGFQSVMVRSQEGGENGDTSALKDRATGNVDIPSDCGAIKIEKTDALTGEHLAGAKFRITPDPTPGSKLSSVTVTDNDANVTAGEVADADSSDGYITILNVKPGEYTVEEIDPPNGYLLPPPGCDDSDDTDRCTTKTVGKGETATFTFDDMKQYDAPTVTKNAAALYDASYAWSISKTVEDGDEKPGSSASQNIPEGGTATFDYAVTLTDGARTTSNYRVTGTVTVNNPNDSAMVVTLEDVLSDNTECTFPDVADVSKDPGLQVSLSAGDNEFDYTCDPGDNAEDGTNTATVSWDRSVYPQTQEDVNNPPAERGTASGDADYTFAVDKETNKTVTVTDTQHTWTPAWTKTWGVGGTSETRTYSKDFSGVAGTCTDYDNTATITETGQSDSATATVCVGQDLLVTKNKVASLTRTYAFDIDKSVKDSKLDVDPNTGKATAQYKVTVTDGPATDSNWVMSGTIYVSNPNDWQAITLTGMNDAYNGDASSCSIDTNGGMTIAASQKNKAFPYTCVFDYKPDYTGTNVATVTWDENAAATPSGSASGSASVVESDWSVDEVGKTVTVIDDKTVPGASNTLGTVTWAGEGTEHDFTYSLQLAGVPGQCVDYTNTATIKETGQDDDAEVTVCAPLGVSVEKTASGTYDRTYKWLIDKESDKTTVSVDEGGEATFNYTVTATPDGYADSGWTMGGTITVSNPNTFKTMTVDITDTPDVGGGAVCTVTNGQDVLIPAATIVDEDVVPGEAQRSYSCTFASEPAYQGGTNTATASWDGGSANSIPTAVPFSLDDETNKVVTVVDDKTEPGAAHELGTADWSDGAAEFHYSLTKSGVAGACTDYTNTATIVETEQSADNTVTVCQQAPLSISKTVDATYDRTYLWQIDKVADKHEVEITDGGTATFHYEVTVGPDKSEGPGYVDSGWAMTGVITVTNPNGEDVGAITADVTDVTDVGADCTVEAGQNLTIDPGETVSLDYSCTFDGKPDYTGHNTATATWQGNDGEHSVSDVVDVDFALDQEINRYVDVKDNKVTLADPETIGDALDWFDGEQVLGYDLELGGVPGTCVEWTNLAEIVQTEQTASDTVTVCSQADAVLENTVAGTFDRTYAWSIAKQADGTSFTTDGTNPVTVNYTVDAVPGESTDSGWQMAGSLWVQNPNTYKSLTIDIASVNDLGGDNTCALDEGQDLVLPPLGSRTYTYSCAFLSQPLYTGTDTTTVSWDLGDASVISPVELALDQETDKVVHVVDDKTVPGDVVDLGEATWNEEGTPTTFTYSLGLKAAANKCETYTNTAEIVETGATAEATVDVCGPEILPEEEVRPRPPVVKGVEEVLPSTGGPDRGLLWAGLWMVLVGTALLAARRNGRSEP